MVRAKNFMAMLSWGIAFVIFIILANAKPDSDTMFNRFYGSLSFDAWDKNLMRYAYTMMILLVIVSIIGIVINSFRQKRKYDSYSKSLIILGIFGVAGIVIINMFF